MDKYNNLKMDNKKNINPEFFNLFAQELEKIDEKEKEEEKKKNKGNKENKKVNKEENTNDNIVIFISKREVRIVRKLLNLVDNLIVNSNKK
jgi:hypothetical protein